ncbi:MAG: GTP-binding protein, partial [Lachnospiraceae bacterium]|nr:GTP-binding protein [Lachnospiraceae bacterium]
MKVYTTDKIRNVAIIGHGGSGKTSLTEAMALLAGLTTRLGKVDDGNTISDFDKEEQKRKFSISTSVIPIEWDDTKINIFDTPGFFDFAGEVEEALSAAASAIIVINGKAGVEPGTKRAWDLCEKYSIPRYFYISNMDIDDASFKNILEELTALYGKKIAPFNFPIRENEKYVGYVNVVSEKGFKWNAQNKAEECDIPDYLSEYLTSYRESLMEAVAETS